MPDSNSPHNNASKVARQLGAALDAAGCEYALGGAIALGFWAEPRGTLDVDVTLFLPSDQPTACVRLLQTIGCIFTAEKAVPSLTDHGFCQVEFQGLRVDVFLPTAPIYELGRQRRKKVLLADQPVVVWDAETLCVFKMMFFRRRDAADLEQLIQMQANALDRGWVRERIIELYGPHDPRVAQWDELTGEQPQ